jgi:hypothetical protein
MVKGTFIKRDSRTGRFVVGRKSMAKLNAMEGVRQSPSSRSMFEDFDRKGASPEERRKTIAAKHARKHAGLPP